MYIIVLLKCNHIELAKSEEEMKAYRMYYQSYFSKHTVYWEILKLLNFHKFHVFWLCYKN